MMQLIIVLSLEKLGGVDYYTTPITATFIAGTTTTAVNVSLINDTIVEGPETFDLTITILSSLNDRVILGTVTKATGNITDNTGRIYVLITFCGFALIAIYNYCLVAAIRFNH